MERDGGEGWWNEVDRVLYGNAIMGGLGYCVQNRSVN